MTKKNKRMVDLFINIIIVILTICAVIWMFFFGENANLSTNGVKVFEYYTVDSSILLAATCALVVVYRVNRRKYELGNILYAFKFMSVVSVVLTFLTVVLILAPMGFQTKVLFCGPNFIFHILNPILAIPSFVLCEYSSKSSKNVYLTGVVPIIVYSAILLPLIGMKILPSPYPFMDIKAHSWLESVVTFVLMMLFTIIISYILKLINNKLNG